MIGYTLSIGFIGIEMFGFMSGITMFSPTNGFICILFFIFCVPACIFRSIKYLTNLFFLNLSDHSYDLPWLGYRDDVLFPSRLMEL